MHSKLLQLAQNLCQDDFEIGGIPWESCTLLQRARYQKKAEEILIFVLRDQDRHIFKKVAERHKLPFQLVQTIWREIIDLISE